MKDFPACEFGGHSPVTACLRHSMMVCALASAARAADNGALITHRLARAVAADDQRQRLRESDHAAVFGAEAADAFDEEPAQSPARHT